MASLSVGIVGLPNVGKSTLFRALTAVAVPAENYPFCTIEPNTGIVPVPDPRLDRLAELCAPRVPVHATVEFVDIAGLVEGASRGEGLGNRFLHHVREASALAHVIRVFRDPAVARTDPGPPDPVRDREVVETELALADLETVGRRREGAEKRALGGDRSAGTEVGLLERLERRLDRGEPARREPLSEGERARAASLHLLTMKPVLYVLNVAEDERGGDEPEAVRRFRNAVARTDPDAACLVLCARLEAEIAQLPADERREYLAALGLWESGLDRLIREGYRLLGLQTFFTIGDAEVRAWTVPAGARAPEAAGRVHTDFERGFIRAERIGFDEFVEMGSLREARDRGRVRFEGKEYVVRDGDILQFRTAG